MGKELLVLTAACLAPLNRIKRCVHEYAVDLFGFDPVKRDDF